MTGELRPKMTGELRPNNTPVPIHFDGESDTLGNFKSVYGEL